MKTDLTQLDPMQRAIVLSIKRQAPEPLNDKPTMRLGRREIVCYICAAVVGWSMMYLAAQVIRWALKGWL